MAIRGIPPFSTSSTTLTRLLTSTSMTFEMSVLTNRIGVPRAIAGVMGVVIIPIRGFNVTIGELVGYSPTAKFPAISQPKTGPKSVFGD